MDPEFLKKFDTYDDNTSYNVTTYSINEAIDLIGTIIQNTIFSKKENENTMKLFSHTIKEDIIQKCYDVFKKYNISLPEKQFQLLTKDESMGTSLQGYLFLNYNQIVELFGLHNYGPSDDGKIDWEWLMKINGEVITIYNYKTGPSYSKNNINVKPQDLHYWHLGGKTKKILQTLEKYIEIPGVIQGG